MYRSRYLLRVTLFGVRRLVAACLLACNGNLPQIARWSAGSAGQRKAVTSHRTPKRLVTFVPAAAVRRESVDSPTSPQRHKAYGGAWCAGARHHISRSRTLVIGELGTPYPFPIDAPAVRPRRSVLATSLTGHLPRRLSGAACRTRGRSTSATRPPVRHHRACSVGR